MDRRKSTPSSSRDARNIPVELHRGNGAESNKKEEVKKREKEYTITALTLTLDPKLGPLPMT